MLLFSMLYATKETTLLKVPRHSDETITTIALRNQFDQAVTTLSVAGGDFTVGYTVPFYYEVKLLKELPLRKGTYTYVLQTEHAAKAETGTLQFEL